MTIQRDGAGRMCPADYRYDPSVMRRAPDITADVVYVIGGLYGNVAALDEIERMATGEHGPVTLVFNGDFHWFDAATDWFSEIDDRVKHYTLVRGNVETEIARANDIGAGCGCAYPESVDNDIVSRSNEILAALRDVAHACELASASRTLPMTIVAQIGTHRAGIVHGDAWSLAGWHFAQSALDDPSSPARLHGLRADTDISLFASTHTCQAALRAFDTPDGPLAVINNGAAGMPNFRDTRFGVISRIGRTPSPHAPLYGAVRDGLHVDALPVHYDHDTFVARFLRRWPKGSAAHSSYFGRINSGPDYSLDAARPRNMVAAA